MGQRHRLACSTILRAAAGVAVALAVTTSTTAVGQPAQPAHVRGSYDATAHPLATAGAWLAGCGTSVDRVSRHTRPLRAPFSGWLHVELHGFIGDWEMEVVDEAGQRLALSEVQYATRDYVSGFEALDVYVEKGRSFSIVTCNAAGSRSARVDYGLRAGLLHRPAPATRTLTTELRYDAAALGVQQAWLGCVRRGVGCLSARPPSFARYMTVQVDDDTSPAVAAEYTEYAGGTSFAQQRFCTALDRPVPISRMTNRIRVVLLNGPCSNGTPAQATGGTATFTWSTHP